MDVSNESLVLSNLIVMLEKVLEATNITKKSVCTSCLDVRTLLKDWCLPDDREPEIPTCTCFEYRVNGDKRIEEIAKDIEDVVGNAQKLREELSSRTTKTNRSRLHPVPNQMKTSTLSPQIGSLPGKSCNRSRPSQTGLKVENRSISKLGSRPSPTSNQRNVTNGRPTIRSRRCSSESAFSSSRSNTSLQSTYQQDYTPNTSPRISNNPSKVKVTTGLKTATSYTSSQNEESVSATITMAQLDILLNRVSIGRPMPRPSRHAAQHTDLSTNVPLMHTSQECYRKQLNDACLIHGKAIYFKTNMSKVRVDFREAIDRLGVPSELVKILKPYHSFIDKLQHQNNQISKEKKVSNQFLDRINLMNKTHWNEALCEPAVCLFSEYTTLFKESSKHTKLTKSSVLKFRVKMNTLEQSYRKCSSHDASFLSANKIVQSDKVTQIKKEKLNDWALTGLWNEKSIRGFCGMEGTLCIRYNNEQQLKNFQENMQQVQRLQYQNHMLELLRKDVLPHLSNLSPNDPTFFALFKTVAALCDVKNLTLPIFVKILEA